MALRGGAMGKVKRGGDLRAGRGAARVAGSRDVFKCVFELARRLIFEYVRTSAYELLMMSAAFSAMA